MNDEENNLRERALKIGVAINEARLKHGMTQESLSEACGLSRAQISRIESGKANPRLSTIAKLLDVLQCKLTIEEQKTASSQEPIDLSEHLANYMSKERTERWKII